MNDLPTSMLTQQSAAKPRTGADLEVFGKEAAARYHSGSASTLTSAVVETVKAAGLSPEQVRRVVEFANQTAYLTEFKKEGSAHKVVYFEGGPADPAEVLQDLNDGGGGTVFDPALSDYLSAPLSLGKVASDATAQADLEDAKLASIFGQEAVESTEEVLYPYLNPLQDVLSARDEAFGLQKHAESDFHSASYELQVVSDGLFQEVKQAALSGTPMSYVVAACQQGAPERDGEFMKAAFQVLTPRLIDNGVFASKADLAESLAHKLASAEDKVVNPDHPLPQAYAAFCLSVDKLAAAQALFEEASTATAQADTFLREVTKEGQATNVARFLGNAVGKVPKAWGKAKDLAARGGQHASDFTGEMVRSGGGSDRAATIAGKAVGGAVKYSPHIGAALVAEDAYQKAKFNPATQMVTNFALSRVPGTEQNLLRQHAIYRNQ